MHKLSLFLITLLWVFSVHIRAQLPENLIKQGLSLDSAGKYKEAIAVFGKVIEMEPKLPVAWYNRGVSRLHAKQYSLAVVDFNKCIFMDTGIIEAYFNRFLAYKFTQNYQFALSDISHYIKRFPEDKVARAQRFLLAEEMEEWSLAISDKKWQLQHDFDFVKNESRNQNQLLSSLYLKAGSYDSALYFINKAIPAQPDNWTLLYERAGILQKMAEYQKLFFPKKDCNLNWKKACQKLQIGGERGYGWGDLEYIKSEEITDTQLFDEKCHWTAQDNSIVIKVSDSGH
jgi:tetratricopeptide (TPR) repeat protein